MMSKRNDKLKDYMGKRDFKKTPEPSQEGPALEWTSARPIFVIQKHDASTLHYDFRIEVDGVLKSWAVPKGPSTDPGIKRLAVSTEDHPLEYADFEGTIPEGEYGGGTVLIWDRGSYRIVDQDAEDSGELSEQIEKGRIAIWLEGQKLRGGFALIRTGKGPKARWLLIKMKDEEASSDEDPVSTQPESVKSGRVIEQIRDDERDSD